MDQPVIHPNLNPFLSIWLQPRATIRHIIESDPQQYVLPLAALTGVYQVLETAANRSLGDSFSLLGILIFALIGGPIVGIGSLYVGGAIFRWSGSLLGGHAPSDHVRVAIAWSSLPRVVLLLIYVPIILIYGRDWFTSTVVPPQNILAYGIFVVALAILALIVWNAILFIKCLAEVHGFSAWRSLAASIIGVLVVALPSLAISIILN